MEDLGPPGSYLTLESGMPAYSREGESVGRVSEVLAEGDKDIFEGIVLDRGLLSGPDLFVAADRIAEIRERGVVLDLTEAEVAQLPRSERG